MISSSEALVGGFKEPVFNSQSVFKAAMDGMARPGTIIQLRIRRERSAIGEIEAVRDALRDHARALELPIRVGSDPRPINAA